MFGRYVTEYQIRRYVNRPYLYYLVAVHEFPILRLFGFKVIEELDHGNDPNYLERESLHKAVKKHGKVELINTTSRFNNKGGRL